MSLHFQSFSVKSYKNFESITSSWSSVTLFYCVIHYCGKCEAKYGSLYMHL